MLPWRVTREQVYVRINHDAHQFVKSDFWFPAKNFLRLCSVTQKNVHLGWPLISRVVLYELLPIEISVGECRFDKLAYRVAFTGSQNEVVSLSKLRNRHYRESRFASKLLRNNSFCRPGLIVAIARETLRVTNASPRRGLSWLNRVPLLAQDRSFFR